MQLVRAGTPNVHRRFFQCAPTALHRWLELAWSGTELDIFPGDYLPTWRWNPDGHEVSSLTPGHTKVGHGPFEFMLREWDGLRWSVDFRGNGATGHHYFECIECDGGTELVHTLELDLSETHPLLMRMALPIHDWAMEALLDRLEIALATGRPPERTRRAMQLRARLLYALLCTWKRLHRWGVIPSLFGYRPEIRPPESAVHWERSVKRK